MVKTIVRSRKGKIIQPLEYKQKWIGTVVELHKCRLAQLALLLTSRFDPKFCPESTSLHKWPPQFGYTFKNLSMIN